MWIIHDLATTLSVPGDVEAVIEDYLAALESRDEQAIRAAMTDDFVINEYIYSGVGTDVNLTEHVAGDVDGIIDMGFRYEWQNELLGDPLLAGENPWSFPIRNTGTSGMSIWTAWRPMWSWTTTDP